MISLVVAASAWAGPWEPLFNGRDLSGWRQIQGAAPYAVADGAIVGTAVLNSPNSFLATEKTYGDFILEFEVKQSVPASNSGVQFRSLLEERNDGLVVCGYQCEIDPSGRGWTAGIYDEQRKGWLYPVTLNPEARSLYRNGEWNHIRIEAIGPSLRTWLNGRPVAHVIDRQTAEGFIALQVHSIGKPEEAGRVIAWRNLRIQTQDITPSPADDLTIRNTTPNEVSAAEAAQGWRLLWDGRTTKGWRRVHQTGFPEKVWKIENGELVVASSGGSATEAGGDIVTEEEFGAFELQLEFKLTAGANSGIKYFVVETPGSTSGGGVGLEYQLLDDTKHPDAKRGAAGNRTLASLYDLIPREKMPGGLNIAPRVGEWQHARIVARADGRVEHWLNGIKVVEFQRGSPLFAALVARSKYEKIEGFGLAPRGRILLQDHGDEVHFRSIKIRSLE